jgi:hypothetical protein
VADRHATADDGAPIRLDHISIGKYAPQLFQTSSGNVQVTRGEHGWRLAITTESVFLGDCLEPRQMALQPVSFRFEAA